MSSRSRVVVLHTALLFRSACWRTQTRQTRCRRRTSTYVCYQSSYASRCCCHHSTTITSNPAAADWLHSLSDWQTDRQAQTHVHWKATAAAAALPEATSYARGSESGDNAFRAIVLETMIFGCQGEIWSIRNDGFIKSADGNKWLPADTTNWLKPRDFWLDCRQRIMLTTVKLKNKNMYSKTLFSIVYKWSFVILTLKVPCHHIIFMQQSSRASMHVTYNL